MDTIFNFFKSIGDVLYNKMLTTLLAAMPESWHPTLDSSITPYLGFIEMWFPLSFGITLLMAWCTYKLIFITIHLVKEWLPGF